MIKQVDTHSELQSLIEGHQGLVVVEFFATWNGYCKKNAPKIEEWSKTYTSVLFLKVDVDVNAESTSTYSVTCLPTFLLFKGGEQVDAVINSDLSLLRDSLTVYA